MNLALQFEKINLTFLQDLWKETIIFLPKILAAFAIILIGWICIKITIYIAKKALKFSKIDTWADKLNQVEIFQDSNFRFKPTAFIVKAIKWILILIVVIIVADILELQMISQEIANLIRYLPKLFSAVAILMIGVYVASIVRNSVRSLFKSFQLGGSNIVGNIIFYVILVIIAITALNQAGINTSVITSNITIILGTLLLAFTIAFGLGSKEIVERLFFGFYTRKNLEVGQHVRIGEIQGTIHVIDNINLTLKTNEGKIIIPIKEVNDSIVQIFNE